MNLQNFGFSEAIAFVALVVAFFYGWQNSKLTKRLLLKEAGVAEAKARADLCANFLKIGKSHRLKIFNRGNAAARNVRIELLDADDHCFIQSDIDSKFPHESIEPHQSVELMASVHLGSKSKHRISLIWDDEFKSNNEKTVYPTI